MFLVQSVKEDEAAGETKVKTKVETKVETKVTEACVTRAASLAGFFLFFL